MGKLPLSRLKPNTKPPREAGFFACLCKTDSSESVQFLLKLCCYPIHKMSEVEREIHSKHRVLLQDDGNSSAPLCERDEIRVALQGVKASKSDLKVR